MTVAPDSPSLSARRASRERDILASARRRFAREGYDTTSVADIARDVGVVEGTIYTYFESKRALLHRLIAEFYEPLIAEVALSVRGISGARNRIRYFIWRQLRAFADEPELCYLIIRELQPRADAYDSIVVGLARRYTSLAVNIVEEAIASGEIRSEVSPFLVRAIIYGSVENVAWRLTFRKEGMDIDQISDALTDVLFTGIGPRSITNDLADAVVSLESVVRELRGTVDVPTPARTVPVRKSARSKR
jgi:AcrR family transcriptional regulator